MVLTKLHAALAAIKIPGGILASDVLLVVGLVVVAFFVLKTAFSVLASFVGGAPGARAYGGWAVVTGATDVSESVRDLLKRVTGVARA